MGNSDVRRLRRRRTYESWRDMKYRCLNPAHPFYRNYGARGIAVCERWLKFENFLADMGIRPTGLTLERKNNDGSYEPGNCRWATMAEQNRNRSQTRLLAFGGKTMCVRDWAVLAGVKPNTAIRRLLSGWTSVEAIFGRVK